MAGGLTPASPLTAPGSPLIAPGSPLIAPLSPFAAPTPPATVAPATKTPTVRWPAVRPPSKPPPLVRASCCCPAQSAAAKAADETVERTLPAGSPAKLRAPRSTTPTAARPVSTAAPQQNGFARHSPASLACPGHLSVAVGVDHAARGGQSLPRPQLDDADPPLRPAGRRVARPSCRPGPRPGGPRRRLIAQVQGRTANARFVDARDTFNSRRQSRQRDRARPR